MSLLYNFLIERNNHLRVNWYVGVAIRVMKFGWPMQNASGRYQMLTISNSANQTRG